MENMRALNADEPVMLAWTAHKQTEEYQNTLRWAGQSNEGNLWAVFLAGFNAPKPTQDKTNGE